MRNPVFIGPARGRSGSRARGVALVAILAVAGCGEDVTAPLTPVGPRWPQLELATETGQPILLGTIPASPGITPGRSYGVEVNDNGEIAAVALVHRQSGNTTSTSIGRAAYWSAATGMVEIGPLEYGQADYCVEDQSIALGINAGGQVVGFADNCLSGQRGFAWSLGSPPIILATPAGATSVAFDINDAGMISGTLEGVDGFQSLAAVWDNPSSQPRLLPALPGYTAHYATGINNRGDVVGYAWNMEGARETPVLWPSGGDVLRLDLPEGWYVFDVLRVNDRGLISGSVGTPSGDIRASLWNPFCGRRIDLGPGTVYNIDGNGRVVGRNNDRGFVWTAEAGQTFLGLMSAYGISNAGHVVGETLEDGGVLTRVGFTNPNRTPLGVARGPYVVDEGSTVVLGDPPASNPHGYPICYAWDFGGGVTAQTPTVTRTFDDDAIVPFTLTVTDAQAATETLASSVTVNNVAPTATVIAPSTVKEGDRFTVQMTNVVDPSPVDVAAGLQYSFDCGGALGYRPFGAAALRSCPAPNDGVRVVRARVADKDGGVSEYTTSVTVENVAPAVVPDSNQVLTVAKNTPFTLAFTFYDPGARDRWSYTVDFSNPSCPAVTHAYDALPALAPGTTYSVTCQSGYPPPKQGMRSYPVTLFITVSDRDVGGSTTIPVEITVTK